MKKILMIASCAVAAFLCMIPLQAQNGRGSNTPVLVERSGNELNPKVLEFDGGRYKYSMDGKGFMLKNRGEVKYAWIPRPEEVREADNLYRQRKFAEAVTKYLASAEKYKYLSWEPYCRLKAAESKQGAKDDAGAISVLEPLMSYKDDEINPKNEADFRSAQKLLGSLYVSTGEPDKALKVADSLALASDDVAACSAYLLKGDALLKKADGVSDKRSALKEAALAYFQGVILFQERGGAENHAEGLLKSYQTLKAMNDSRADAFAKELKEKYKDYADRNLK